MKEYFLGTSGFSYSHWISRFYPEGLPQYKWLEYYTKFFNTFEANVSFYRFPTSSLLKSWYNKTPSNFLITLKANRMITHVKKLKNTKRVLNDFYKIASLLKDKSGAILFQLPPSLKYDKSRLESFLKQLNQNYENVIEFRNDSWFNQEVYDLLEKYNTSFCIVSGLGLKRVIKVTSNIAYFRFHGSERAYSSSYSYEQLKTWSNHMKKINAKKIYAYFNNDDHAYAVENCKTLQKLLKIK